MKKYSPYTLCYAGVLIAMNIVLSRIVSIPVGNTIRITVSLTPVMLSGLWFGPVVGGAVGALGDLIGCMISGYAPNPLLTCSAALAGIIPAVMKKFILRSPAGKFRFLRILAVTFGMMIITSQGISTLGLSLMYGMPFWPTFITRLPQTAITAPVDAFLVELFFSRVRLPQAEKAHGGS